MVAFFVALSCSLEVNELRRFAPRQAAVDPHGAEMFSLSAER